eukprot:COSAG01_NODE_1020_length_12097_cov_3.014919_1_plen_76_part_10
MVAAALVVGVGLTLCAGVACWKSSGWVPRHPQLWVDAGLRFFFFFFFSCRLIASISSVPKPFTLSSLTPSTCVPSR